LTSAKSGDEAYQECRALGEKENYEKAIECFELLKSRFTGSHAAYEADLEIGDNYFRKGEYLLAAETYLAFAKLHPTHERVGYAYYKTGLSYLKESPKAIDRDQQYLNSAIQYLELAVQMTSGDIREVAREKLMEARSRIAKRHFYIGRFYYRTGEYIAAIPRFQEILIHYNGLGLDEKSLYLLGDSFRRISEKEKALEILSVFDQHFPTSPYRKRLAGRIE
jgi:outer membrane protein assembly factor BamD